MILGWCVLLLNCYSYHEVLIMNPKYIYERLGSVPNIVKLKVWDIFRPKRSLDLALKSVTLFLKQWIFFVYSTLLFKVIVALWNSSSYPALSQVNIFNHVQHYIRAKIQTLGLEDLQILFNKVKDINVLHLATVGFGHDEVW